jgi:transcriptional regulator with XRE-family HTH domain
MTTISDSDVHRCRELSRDQCAVIGANIRAMRLERGWTQQQLGELMGWSSASTVCRVEGNRGGRQRSLTVDELGRLAAIFNVNAQQLKVRCVTCGGRPPTGFACLTCGAHADVSLQGAPRAAGKAHA